MSIFKKKLTADEIIKALSDLSEDELNQVVSAMENRDSETQNDSEANSEPVGEEAVSETERQADSEPETGDSGEEEQPGEDSPEADTNAPENAQEEPENVEADENAEHEQQDAVREAAAAQDAKYSALESEVKNLKSMLESVLEKAEAHSFGVSPSVPQTDEDDEDDRIMRSYYGASYNRAKF